MNIKRCTNCGSFTTSDNSICDVCVNKLKYNTTVLNSYFEGNASFESIKSISSETGISPSIIQKYMIDNHYIDEPSNTTTDFYTNMPY